MHEGILLKFFLTLCCLFLPSIVQASCMKAAVIESKPVGYVKENGMRTGVHWDFLSQISQISGQCIEKDLLPFARVWGSLEAGSYDLAVGFSSASRDNKVIKVALIRELKTIVVGAKGTKVRHYEDLAGLTIGKTRATKLNYRFDNDVSLHIVELNDYQHGVDMLLAGRIDALAGSYRVIKYQLEQLEQVSYLDKSGFHVLGAKQQWLHMSKQSQYQEAIPLLKRAVEILRDNGALSTLINKHYNE